MGRGRHEHKESFSVLLISNTGRNSRQFHMPLAVFNLILCIIVLAFAALAWFAWQFGTSYQKTARLQNQLAEQMRELENEKAELSSRNIELAQENEALRTKQQEEETTEEETRTTDPFSPTRYPYEGNGMWIDAYSAEHEYITIHTKAEGNIIAAGSGTVASVSADEVYPLIIEIDHRNGYRTRYMCMQEAEVRVQEGAQVENGDTLAVIRTDDTQLDYQVIFNEKPIDPLIVIEAKG